jgi:4-aminobutyrate aminotransferase-like enzyme
MRDGELAIDEKLEDLKRADTIELTTSARPADVENALHATANVVVEDDRIFLTRTGVEPEELAAQVARALVAKEIPIHSLAPVQRDLERLFREVSEVHDVR